MANLKKTVPFTITKKNKGLSEAEKERLVLNAESELIQFRRRYTLLRTSKIAHEAVHTLHNQRRVLKVLRAEHNEIATDMVVVDSSENKAVDSKNSQLIHELLAKHHRFKHHVQAKKLYMKELDLQITLAKKSILSLKKQLPNYHQEKMKVSQQNFILETLENKLECATKRFCIILAENRKLRHEIKGLLYERSRFTVIWNQLLENLAEARKFMIDLIEMATTSYDRREEWLKKLEILRQKIYTDYISQTTRMCEMRRVIYEGLKLEMFFRIKCSKRIMQKMMDKEALRREQQKNAMQEMIENYTHLLDNIKKYTNEGNIHNIVKKYLRAENKNYSNLKRVLHLNSELDELCDGIQQIQAKTQDCRIRIKTSRAQHENEILDLEKQLQDAKDRADKAESDLKNTENDFVFMLTSLENIFKQLKIENPLTELLGENNTINEYNVSNFVKLIEARLYGIITNVCYRDLREYGPGNMSKHIVLTGERVSSFNDNVEKSVVVGPCPLCTEKEMVGDVIDSLQTVMSHNEIVEYLEEAKQHYYYDELIHNVSGCHLPKARAIMQSSFQ